MGILRVFAVVLFVTTCLMFTSGTQSAAIGLTAGPSSLTVIAGQELTVSCNFITPLGSNLNVFWRKSNNHLGRCQWGHLCQSWKSWINLTQSDRTDFTLTISNVNQTHSGLYECGIENRTQTLTFTSLRVINVAVVPEDEISNPTCLTTVPGFVVREGITSSSFGLHLSCSWPASYLQATAVISTADGEGEDYEGIALPQGELVSVYQKVAINELGVGTGRRCNLAMPGMTDEHSCTFGPLLTPPIIKVSENQDVRINCTGVPTGRDISWLTLEEGNIIPSRIRSVEANWIIFGSVPMQWDGFRIICATKESSSGNYTVIGIHQLRVISEIPTTPNSLATNPKIEPKSHTKDNSTDSNGNGNFAPIGFAGDITTPIPRLTNTLTVGSHYIAPSRANDGIQMNAFSFRLQCLIYYCVVASSFALMFAVIAVCRTCHYRKVMEEVDAEQPVQVAKVAAIPSHSAEDYATIDSSKLKSKHGKSHEGPGQTAGQENPCRYHQPSHTNVTPHTVSLAPPNETPSEYAAPCIPKRRAQSVCTPGHSLNMGKRGAMNKGPLLRNFSLQEMTPSYQMSRHDNIDETDEESTLGSRVSQDTVRPTPNAFYFCLDNLPPGEKDAKPEAEAMSTTDETTLGRERDPDYFTLEQAPQYEVSLGIDDDAVSTTTNNNIDAPTKSESGYDNFRAKRIPYTREDTCTSGNDYEQLTCTSKG